jgi:ectoine hydroxylase-related dioxygenase (phytanoyl-CoA dioxygenase family)
VCEETRVALLPLGVRTRLSHARSHLERGLRGFVYGDVPTWRRRPNVRPWFDAPDALAHVGAHAADAHEDELFTQWIRDGYFVARDLVPAADVDEMIATLDGLWDAATPIAGLELLDLRETRDEQPRAMSHAALLAEPPERRARMRQASDWRIHGFHYVNAAAHRIFHNAALRGVVSRLFGRPARPFAAINFMSGSQQHLHQDMAVFHIYPHDYLVGAWIACEDVRPECGPLVIHAGSHTRPMFPGFTDYPQTNLRTADAATAAAYQRWIDEVAAEHPRHEFLARKGEVLFWHGMLAHGGAPVTAPGTTRKSMVLHYTVRGADRGREVRGPFNW